MRKRQAKKNSKYTLYKHQRAFIAGRRSGKVLMVFDWALDHTGQAY